jgi:hypothetical protein
MTTENNHRRFTVDLIIGNECIRPTKEHIDGRVVTREYLVRPEVLHDIKARIVDLYYSDSIATKSFVNSSNSLRWSIVSADDAQESGKGRSILFQNEFHLQLGRLFDRYDMPIADCEIGLTLFDVSFEIHRFIFKVGLTGE